MIKMLIINLPYLISLLLKSPIIIFKSICNFIERLRTGYFKTPHWKDTIYLHGSFGAGKGVLAVDKVRKCIAKYPNCDIRILSNMTLNMDELKKLGFKPENYRFFNNVDDLDFLLETKIDEKNGEEVPTYDGGILLLDELSAVLSNRSFMNSKKGKGVINQDFLSLLYQVRKFKVLTILQSQTPAFDITFRRLITQVHCPHMRLCNSYNSVNVYDPDSFFTYLDDKSLPVPEPIRKYFIIVKKEIFKTYNTRQLVRGIVEGDYFRSGDKDLPLHLGSPNTVSVHQPKKMPLTQKLLGNKKL